jgi:hypothetical protein
MLCPLLPGIADSPEQIDRLARIPTALSHAKNSCKNNLAVWLG